MGSYVGTFFGRLQHMPPLEALLLLMIGMLLESTAIPMPSEVVLPLAGVCVAQGKFSPGIPGLVEAILTVTVGSLIGSALSYAIGFYGGKPFLKRFGKYARITPERIDSSEDWVRRHGMWAIAVGRLVFGVRHVQSLVAGALRVSFWPFLGYTFIGCTLWNSLGVFLGYRYKEAIKSTLDKMSLGMLLLVVVIGLVVYGLHHWRKQHKE